MASSVYYCGDKLPSPGFRCDCCWLGVSFQIRGEEATGPVGVVWAVPVASPGGIYGHFKPARGRHYKHRK